MKRSFVYVMIAAIGVSVSSCASKNTAGGSDSAVPAYELLDLPKVKLKDFRKNSDGAYVLFDGSSLEGWRGYNKEHVPSKWSIDNGTLKFSGDPAGVENP